MWNNTNDKQPADDEQADLLEPINTNYPNAFTLFQQPPEVEGYIQSADIIIEHDGIFSISEKIETATIKLDPDFKQLVDSILLQE